VPDYQLSLAIGKEGQNARLAARLTGLRIDIKSETQATDEGRREARRAEAPPAADDGAGQEPGPAASPPPAEDGPPEAVLVPDSVGTGDTAPPVVPVVPAVGSQPDAPREQADDGSTVDGAPAVEPSTSV
jgi:hypothetical protein